MKECTSCRKVLPRDSFHNRKASPDGKVPRCKDCVAQYKREHRKNNPDKYQRKSLRYYDLPQDKRNCRLCGEIKHVDDFYKDNSRPRGYSYECKPCLAEYRSKIREEDYSAYIETRRKWAERNRDKLREQQRKYRGNRRINEARRRARKKSLPDTLTQEQAEMVFDNFGGKCAICESPAEHLDHFIPLATGHGGTTYENSVPLCQRCNASKHARNPFEWAAGLAELERERFHRLVKYLAELNGIAAAEDYEAHVNHCFK